MVYLTQMLNMTIFQQNISQGRVATLLRCGGTFDNHFTTNLLTNLPLKEFVKIR